MKNRYDSEQTIDDIVSVATDLFTSKGFDKTSIQDIVNELEGLTRGAIYHHFASKDEIMIAVIRKRLPLADFYLENKLKGLGNAREKMSAFLLENIKPKSKVENWSILENNPRIFVEMLRIYSEVLAPQVQALLDEGNRDGSLTIANTKEVAEVFMLLVGNWFTSLLYPDTKNTFGAKVSTLNTVLMSLGLDLMYEGVLEELKNR